MHHQILALRTVAKPLHLAAWSLLTAYRNLLNALSNGIIVDSLRTPVFSMQVSDPPPRTACCQAVRSAILVTAGLLVNWQMARDQLWSLVDWWVLSGTYMWCCCQFPDLVDSVADPSGPGAVYTQSPSPRRALRQYQQLRQFRRHHRPSHATRRRTGRREVWCTLTYLAKG